MSRPVRFGLICILILFIAFLYNPQIARAIRGQISDNIISSLSSTILIDNLIDQCNKHSNMSGWVYVSYREEIPGSSGYDPETGVKLPENATWEIWYYLDSDGAREQMVSRRHDNDNDNVWQVVYKNRKMYTYPAGHSTLTEYNDPEKQYPLKERCAVLRGLQQDKPYNSTAQNLVHRYVTGANGDFNIEFTTKTIHPGIETYVGSEVITIAGSKIVHTRGQKDGIQVSSQYYVITPDGDEVYIGGYFDYLMTKIDVPPNDVIAILLQSH